MKLRKKFAVLLAITLVYPAGYAQLTDLVLADRFPDSVLSSAEFEADTNYRLVLGRLQRSRGVVVPESSERIRGDVSKLIFEIPREYSGEDVFGYFQSNFYVKGYEKLFECIGRECGSSNYWANDIFRNRVLYGPERNQYFLNVRVPSEGKEPAHISLYVITRGNRRTYSYLEIVEPSGTSGPITTIEDTILIDIEKSGATSLPGITFLSDEQLDESVDLSELAQELLDRPDQTFYLVSHLSAEGELDQLLARSIIRAEAVRSHLIDLGVDESQLVSKGIGPLAPLCAHEQCADRIELVLVRSSN
ncbi:MAG TPA: hypothetical protein DEF79_10790 [Gammaproteobacteria bacterium]|nr:hypothetical protein [Gammaproteobacteria bacterium]